MKRLIMMLLLVALAIPATAFAGFGSSGHGTCVFTTNDKTKTVSLVADCTTDTTVGVQDGWTLDGKGFTITAVDGPTGTSFEGAVVQNDGTAMNVKNLKIEGGVPNNCVATFNGVAFMGAGGSIKNVTLNNIGRTTGCQSGRAIVVWNTEASAPPRSVAIENNTVTSYNKNGIDVRGNVNATILGNTVTGTASDLIARNGIVVYGTQTVAQVGGNKVTGNDYTGPADTYATGILVIDAKVSIDRKNTVSGNEKDIEIAGTGTIGGKFSA
jgi:hypothetical protein